MTSKYYFWSSLLNRFKSYQEGWITSEEMVNAICNAPITPNPAMSFGVDFEDLVCSGPRPEPGKIIDMHGFSFNSDLIYEYDPWIQGACFQFPVTYTFVDNDTQKEVMTYGHIDLVNRDFAADIKTTGKYDGHKFQDSYQHRVYMCGLHQRGFTDINNFHYLITNRKDFFVESYPYDEEEYKNTIKHQCRRLIDFIETYAKVNYKIDDSWITTKRDHLRR